MEQLRNVMLEVKWGEARGEWLGVCDAVLESLHRMAQKMEMTELCAALEGFQSTRAQVQKRCQGALSGADRQALLDAYGPLVVAIPSAFDLDAEYDRREAVIVQSLLRQVTDVEKVTIDRLFAAGLTSLRVFYQANADDVASTTSITRDLAARIVEVFQRYRKTSGATVGAAVPAEELRQLALLVTQLRNEHVAFEEASAQWTSAALVRKKKLRCARGATLQQVRVALARLGEVDRVNELERMAFRCKIDEIERYLEQSRTAPSKAPVASAIAQEGQVRA
jgi:hypothetical protein